MFIDISSIQTKSIGGSKYWLLVLDDTTGYCWSLFLKSKDKVSEKIIELVKEQHQMQVKIRCDNADENNSVDANSKKKDLNPL